MSKMSLDDKKKARVNLAFEKEYLYNLYEKVIQKYIRLSYTSQKLIYACCYLVIIFVSY